MQVGGNGSLAGSPARLRDSVANKAARAVADIKDDAALACFEEDGIEFAVGKNDGELLGKDVRVNVAGARFFQDEIGVSAIGTGPEIEHHRAIGGIATGNGVIDGLAEGYVEHPKAYRSSSARFSRRR